MSRTLSVMWLAVAIYTVVVVGVGLVTVRWIRSGQDFMLAGRGISRLLQGIGMTSIIVAGTTGATVGALGYLGGMVGHWWITAWILAVVLGAFTIAPFARRTGGVTLTEWLEAAFDGRVRLLAGVALAFGLFFSPLANVLGGGLVASGLLGISPDAAISLVGAIAVVYLILGGLWAAVFSDLIQYVLFTLAFVGGVLFVVLREGGIGLVADRLPGSYFNPLPHGPVPAVDWTAGSAFGLFFLMFALAFGGTYWHRAASSRAPSEARSAWLLGALLAVPFAVVMPLAGMYLRATGVQLDDPQQAFGVFMADTMPLLLAALMLTGILAATMSTVEAGVVAGASILFRDVLQKHPRFARIQDRREVVRWIRIITFAYSVLAIGAAVLFQRAVPESGALVGLAFLSAFSAALLPAVLASMVNRSWCSNEAATVSIAGSMLYTGYSLVSGTYQTVHPMLVSAIVALVLYVAVAAVTRVTGPWWRTATAGAAAPGQTAPERTESTEGIERTQ